VCVCVCMYIPSYSSTSFAYRVFGSITFTIDPFQENISIIVFIVLIMYG